MARQTQKTHMLGFIFVRKMSLIVFTRPLGIEPGSTPEPLLLHLPGQSEIQLMHKMF